MRAPSLEQARRVAVRPAGLAGGPTTVLDTAEWLGDVQLGPTSAVARTHLLVLWSRLGTYDPTELDRLLWQEKKLLEWHAFIWPARDVAVVRAGMRAVHAGPYAHQRRAREWLEQNAEFAQYVVGELARRGPLRSRELEDRARVPWRSGGWNDGKNLSRMPEILAQQGRILVAGRAGDERLWDVAERVLAAGEELDDEEASRRAALIWLRAQGLAWPGWVGMRGFVGRGEIALRELADRGEVERVTVEGLGGWLYAHPDALADDGWEKRTTLLSPFDTLIRGRERTEELFGFRYRLEIYVPKSKREYGYWVMPVLAGDELVGRADLIHDRRANELRVNAAYPEPGRVLDLDEPLTGLAAFVGDQGRVRVTPSTIQRMDFETRAIHVGQEPDPATGAVTTPIYQTSTFAQEAVGVHKGYDYARVANPTRTALEECLASLEGAAHGHAFSSGLGATTTVMHLVDPGRRIVAVNDVYGGVYRMFSQVYEPKGYRFTWLPAAELNDGLADHLDEDVALVWLESPTNPLLNLVDIEAAAAAAHAAGALVVVDNTFATPYLQQPLELGADIVVHSTTKYLGGHSDVVGGFAATNDASIAERLRFLQKSLGAVPGPFDAWLVLRGVKTLAVRMRAHCENARAVVAFLGEHPAVEQVLYPGLRHHPGHDIAARQMRDFGGMVSFLVESEQEAVELVARTRVWTLAESLGGVESLIEHPYRMTHASTASAPFAAPRNLVRLSVGIESATDLVGDLEAALTPAASLAT